MSNQWIILDVQIHKPIPVLANPEQQRRPVKHGRERRRSAAVREVGFADDVDVAGGSEGGNGADLDGEGIALLLGGEEVEVEEVEVAGVVEGVEEAEEAVGVAGGRGEEVGEGRGRGRWR